MARHDEWKAVVRAERAGGALCARPPREARKLGIRDDLAVRHSSKRREHVSLEGRPTVGVDLDLRELDSLACEVRAHVVNQAAHIRRRFVTDA